MTSLALVPVLVLRPGLRFSYSGVCMKICTGIHATTRFCFILVASFFLLVLTSLAQSQSEDVQQMRDKLQKLEQEIEELKGQLNKSQQAPAQAPASATTTVVVRAE